MSDTMANNTATPRSARAAALERRRALSQGGKAALTQIKAGAGAARLAATVTSALPAVGAVAPIMAPEISAGSDCGCGCKEKNIDEVAERQQTIEEICTIVDDQPTVVDGPIASAVRKLCQERRRALSSQGKTALKPSFARGFSTGRNGGKSAAMAGLSGRDVARARREALSQHGRGDDPVGRPAGRVRTQPVVPPKVETGTTLRGTGVTGTQVERSGKVTGNEPGSCRVITGTEYIGAEQYGELCAMVPTPAPAKVSISSTGSGQRISGTEVGRSIKVTGDEHGACKTVTGIEYLSADQFESFCSTKPVLVPAKVNEATTEAGQSVTGIEVGRNAKVTGDEAGACSKLTGSQYVQADLPASLCGSGAPRKVSVMSTVKERTVTGTEVGRTENVKVTGDEHGACTTVTGTEYAGLAQYQACNREPVPAPEKIGVMRTWRGQPVSGTVVEHSSKVTGNEYGNCQSVSGTEYIGPDQYTAFCDAAHQAASRALMASRGAQASAPPSGTRIASYGKVTGAERGEGLVLSGTPYSGANQRVSQRGANNNAHPLARAPFDAPRQPVEVPSATRVQGDFSIDTPARSAQDKSLNRITGTAYGAIGRITGPVNLAAGLVSGTPEFRYRDEADSDMPVAMAPAIEAARSRLTGDGREGGFAITGAAWRRNESVTGTEGTSLRRNPTLRGAQRSVVMGAAQNKERERPEIPVSKITGSSGNDAKSSAITYSGGARG